MLGGRVLYRQPARGYRVSLEAPLLAAFALPPKRRSPRVLVDLASGPGAVAICLAQNLPRVRLLLVEKDKFHAVLARENLEQNGLSHRSKVYERDVYHCDKELGRGVADLVVSNPPWFDRSGGQPAAEGATREGARGLSSDGFSLFFHAARQLLGHGGRFCFTAPAASTAVFFSSLSEAGLIAKRLRWLHARANTPAQVCFVEAQAARPGGLIIEPPWFVRGEHQEYTSEMRTLLWGTTS